MDFVSQSTPSCSDVDNRVAVSADGSFTCGQRINC